MRDRARDMKLKAEGITCSSCAVDMENILRGSEGVLDASVSFTDEIISVRYDPDVLDRKHVFSAVRRLGYKVKIISES
ncbi:MAG: heavy metal-associated domain-containing protein [Nitrospirota bacterium]